MNFLIGCAAVNLIGGNIVKKVIALSLCLLFLGTVSYAQGRHQQGNPPPQQHQAPPPPRVQAPPPRVQAPPPRVQQQMPQQPRRVQQQPQQPRHVQPPQQRVQPPPQRVQPPPRQHEQQRPRVEPRQHVPPQQPPRHVQPPRVSPPHVSPPVSPRVVPPIQQPRRLQPPPDQPRHDHAIPNEPRHFGPYPHHGDQWRQWRGVPREMEQRRLRFYDRVERPAYNWHVRRWEPRSFGRYVVMVGSVGVAIWISDYFYDGPAYVWLDECGYIEISEENFDLIEDLRSDDPVRSTRAYLALRAMYEAQGLCSQ